MNSPENTRLNFFDFLSRQKHEDRQAFIIHFPGNSGKTAFARRICAAKPEIVYLDLLKSLAEIPDLNIINFKNKELRNYLLGYRFPEDTQTVVVDQMDFLLNTWSDEEKKYFIEWLRVLLRTPSFTPYTFVFFLQDDRVICRQELVNKRGELRILPLNAFYNIE